MAYNKTEITLEELRVHFEKLLRKTFNLPNGTKVLINPSGAWTDSYGAYGDAGLTGEEDSSRPIWWLCCCWWRLSKFKGLNQSRP